MRGDESLNIYFIARRYRDEDEAKEKFEHLLDVQRNDRERRLGVYRCRSTEGTENVIAVVSFGEPGIQWARRVLGGEEYDGFTEAEVEMMVNRRLSAIVGLSTAGAPYGTYRIGHG